MSFIGNLVLLPAEKNLEKSVEIWRSYRHEFGGTLLEHPVVTLSSAEVRDLITVAGYFAHVNARLIITQNTT